MAAPSTKIFSAGMNAARIYELNAAGYPVGASTAVYAGIPVGGPTQFSLTIPDAEIIQHLGNNSVLQRQTMPPTGATSGTLTISRQDAETLAKITGVSLQTTGEMRMLPLATSQQGLEPTVGLLVYQQAKTESGNAAWHSYVFPRATLAPKPTSMSRAAAELTYAVTPNVCTETVAGTALTLADNGCITASIFDYIGNYRLNISGWLADGAAVPYLFDTNLPAAAALADNIRIYVDGILQVAGITYATTSITFAVAPSAGKNIVAMYDLANTAADL